MSKGKPASRTDSSASYAPDPSGRGFPSLLDKVHTACRRSGHSYRTEQAYTRWIVRDVKYHNTRPAATMGKEEV